MASAPALSVVERRGLRGQMGWLVLAGRAVTSRPRSDVEARFPFYGCTFVAAGRGRYRDANHDVNLGPGDLVLVVPGHPHNYGAGRGGWDERFLVFDGPLFRLAATTGLLDVRRPVRSLGDCERWAARFDHFRLRAAPATAAERDAEAALVLALLADMLASAEATKTTDDTNWLDESCRILESDLGARLAMAEVATTVGMSYETWRRAFKSAVGVPPARFRLDHRLTAAAEDLLATSASTRDIAEKLGFTDERHLAARFVESYGCTPTVFRRRRAMSG